MFIFAEGFITGSGLIVAIGAQNSYVLTQGVHKQFNWMVPLICAVCDALLIFAGAAGIGNLVASSPLLQNAAGWAGALFLFGYGARSLFSAVGNNSLKVLEKQAPKRMTVVLTTLAITLFNPHVYLDTLVLLGSMSGQYHGDGRYVFALGAATASCGWFFSLAFGGVLLSSLFQNPLAWRILDSLVCVIMWILAVKLVPL